MAEYVFNSTYDYARDGGSDNASQTDSEDTSGVLTDDGGNMNFDVGETLYVDGNPVGTFYAGYFPDTPPDFDNFYIVVEVDEDTFVIYSSGTVAESELPNTFHEIDDVSPEPSIPVCLGAGTLIATPEGERRVEDLQIGDLVRTQAGETVAAIWIGRQTLHKIFTPAERFVPVRVQAGALGAGVPHRDLILTADHALILDGLAINAGALVNHTTISYEPMDRLPEQVTYYHVETEAHDVILANGAPVETYIDYVARSLFDNHDEYLALYGQDRTITEMPLPRISAARLVPETRRIA